MQLKDLDLFLLKMEKMYLYSEILRLTTGCSVIVTGKVVESPAEGQAVEFEIVDGAKGPQASGVVKL